MLVDDDLEGGRIEVIAADDPRAVRLAICADRQNDTFRQWFAFRLVGAKGKRCELSLENAGAATYPDGFDGYRVCASEDGVRWFRVPTEFDGERLVFRHTPASDATRFAYFAPYPSERRARLVERALASPFARVERLGDSIEGRPMHAIVIAGDGDPGKRVIWINGRQHPGEVMAEWFMEGVAERLLDEQDPLSRELRARATFYLVPCMNPDGAALGNHRTNAAGRDLNRAWTAPDEGDTPEVACVLARMDDTGVDLFLDVHGDERNPYCFAAGCEGNPDYSERIEALEELFEDSLVALDQDFQREYGYPRDLPGEADLSTAGNFVGERFDCLSLTLEMPFKDAANHPDPRKGWAPERAKHLGRSTLESVMVCLDSLR